MNARYSVVGAEAADASRRDAGDAGHRRGAAATQTLPRRPQPGGLVRIHEREHY